MRVWPATAASFACTAMMDYIIKSHIFHLATKEVGLYAVANKRTSTTFHALVVTLRRCISSEKGIHKVSAICGIQL